LPVIDLGLVLFDIEFSISAFLWLLLSISFALAGGIYIKKRYFSSHEVDFFIKKIQKYLNENYPKIKFDYSHLKQIKDPNINTLKILIIDNIVEQFINLDFKPTSRPYLKTNKLWSSYVIYSIPSTKYDLPPDWLKRKEIIFERDKGICQRCFKKIDMKNSDLVLIKPLNENGNFYLENLALVCIDCKKIIEAKRNNKKIKYLNFKFELEKFL